MLLSSLLLIPIIGVFVILVNKDRGVSLKNIKFIALTASILNFLLSLVIFILFDFSTNQFQFVQEYHEISYFDFYLGVDGLSIYFVLLTTIIIPISLLSNWTSISKDVESYVIIILLLETLLLAVFLVLDILLFYIFFESILPPLFILIGIFGSDNRVKASFYLFLYTLLGSLFLLLSILAMSSIMSTTDFDTLFKGNFVYLTQLFLFYGIFIAFAVKTPTIFLNTWLLKAHVESPLGGSIILAAIVLKLSLYGIFRLILPVLPKAYMEYTYIIFLIGVITIVYASLSTLRTIDIKELIAYSSVSHAAVYLIGVFSNSIQGIEGGINLGLAHGLVSPGLFICAGGILYDRSHTRLISFYKGMAQIMPLFAILFFILCLGNCGAPLTLNFVGEFMSLYGVFERSSLFGALASSSIVFSAAYTIYMYQRISFGGSYSRMFTVNIADLNKREFIILLTLVVPTVLFGIYTAPIMDGINYSVSILLYCFDFNIVTCDAPTTWLKYYYDSNTLYVRIPVFSCDLIEYINYYSGLLYSSFYNIPSSSGNSRHIIPYIYSIYDDPSIIQNLIQNSNIPSKTDVNPSYSYQPSLGWPKLLIHLNYYFEYLKYIASTAIGGLIPLIKYYSSYYHSTQSYNSESSSSKTSGSNRNTRGTDSSSESGGYTIGGSGGDHPDRNNNKQGPTSKNSFKGNTYNIWLANILENIRNQLLAQPGVRSRRFNLRDIITWVVERTIDGTIGANQFLNESSINNIIRRSGAPRNPNIRRDLRSLTGSTDIRSLSQHVDHIEIMYRAWGRDSSQAQYMVDGVGNPYVTLPGLFIISPAFIAWLREQI